MHGLHQNGRTAFYTDPCGDGIEISAAADSDGHPVVALVPVLDSGGELVHVDLAHIEDLVAALREKAVEARARYAGHATTAFRL